MSSLGMGRVGSCTQGPAPPAVTIQPLLSVPFHLKTPGTISRVILGLKSLKPLLTSHPSRVVMLPDIQAPKATVQAPCQPFLYTFVPSHLAHIHHLN